MTEDIISLIREGLYQDNLIKLIDLTNQNLAENPTLFFVLNNIFKSLENEYNDQAVTNERYSEVMKLSPLLIEALENPSKDSLDRLIKAFI